MALDGLVAVARHNSDSCTRVAEALKTFYLEEFVAEVKKARFSLTFPLHALSLAPPPFRTVSLVW